MATVIDKLSPSAELGDRFGKGLSTGLQALMDAKLGRLHKQAGLMNSMSPQQAKSLSYLPDNLYSLVVPQLLRANALKGEVTRIREQAEADKAKKKNPKPNNNALDQFINPVQPGPVDPMTMIQQGYGQGANGPQTQAEILNQVLGSQQPLNGQPAPGQPAPGQPSMYEQQMAMQANQPLAQGTVPGQPAPVETAPGQEQEMVAPGDGIVNSDFNYNEVLANNMELHGDKRIAVDITNAAQKSHDSDRKFMQQQGARRMEYQQKRYDSKWDNFEKDLSNESVMARKNEERLAGYKNALSFLETGKAGVGFEAWAKEHLGVENVTDNSVTQALRKVLAREPLEFLVNLAKEGGATAARSKAVFDQVQQATGKMTNTAGGLRNILKINSATLKLQNEYSAIKSEIAQRYKRTGREPDYLIEREVNKRMEPSLKKFQNLGNEIVLNARAANWDGAAKKRYLSKNPLGSNIYLPNINKTFKLGQKNGRLDYKYIGKGRVK